VENPANPQYYYYRHDHLGDNREVWCANTNTVVQRTQYYPSGLPWAYDRTVDHPDLQHRKYNGKEFVEMHGYDTYDIVWRQYYPAIMRFQTPDPYAEKYYSLSPYTMCADNMVRYTDPDGRFIPIILAAIAEAPEIYLLGAAVVASVTASIHHYQSQHQSSTYRYESNNQQSSNSDNTKAKANPKANIAPTITAAPAPKNQNDKKRNNSSSEQTTKQEKIRKSEGADGSTSKHIIKKDANGKTISKTHQVTNTNGEVVHQHQEHISQTPAEGQKPTMRRFPDDWVEHKSVNAK